MESMTAALAAKTGITIAEGLAAEFNIKNPSPEQIESLCHSENEDLKTAGEISAEQLRKKTELASIRTNIIYKICAKLGLVNREPKLQRKVQEDLIKTAQTFDSLPEKIKEEIKSLVSEVNEPVLKLAKLPDFQALTDDLIYKVDEPELCEIYKRLLVGVFDGKYHPSYRKVINELDKEDALAVNLLFSYKKAIPIIDLHQIVNESGDFNVVGSYMLPNDLPISKMVLENLERLNLIKIIIGDQYYNNESYYDYANIIVEQLNSNLGEQNKFEVSKGQLLLTEFGKGFAKAISII